MDLMLEGRGNIMIPSSENNNNDVKARKPPIHHSTSPIPIRIIPNTLQPSSPSTKIPVSAWKVPCNSQPALLRWSCMLKLC